MKAFTSVVKSIDRECDELPERAVVRRVSPFYEDLLEKATSRMQTNDAVTVAWHGVNWRIRPR